MQEQNYSGSIGRTDAVKGASKMTAFLIPSVADILLVGIILRELFIDGLTLLADCDTGYHIRTGEYIIRTLSVPKHDIFSFITPPIPWTAHEWLSEVIMALVHRALGLTGIVVFFGCLIAFIYYLLFRILRSRRGNILVDIGVILLVILSSEIHWLARPHIFSLLLFVIWYHLLDEYQYRNRNYLYLFPFIILLWVNLHGGFVIALVLCGIYMLDNLVKAVSSADDGRTEYRKKTSALILTLAACLLASLINPRGYHILLFPFTLTSNKFLMDNVIEFLSPNFHEAMPFKYLIFLTIATFALSAKKVKFLELVLVLFFLNMALYSERYIPLFAVIAAPILTSRINLILKERGGKVAAFFKMRDERIGSVDASAKGHLWPVTALALVAVLMLSGSIAFSFDEKIKPVAAVEFLRKEPIKGNMFNNDEFGDYIIYAAHEKYKVFFDGRSDMYGVERMKDYFKVVHLQEDWNDVLNKYDISWIIYDADSSLSRFLAERKDWKLIYADKVANIFVRVVPANAGLIEKYRGVVPVTQKETMLRAAAVR